VVYLALKTAQAYYEYFSIRVASKNYKDEQTLQKQRFPFTKILLWVFLKSRRPNWTIKVEKSNERKLSIIKGICHFASIFCIVAFIFSTLQIWLDTTTKIDITKSTILKIEETQFRIKDFVSHFKIGFTYDVLILFLLITLAGAFPFFEQHKIKDKLKKYNKTIKTIIYFLTISTSFTFFGNRLASSEEGRAGKLEFHKLQILEDNKLLQQKINDEVTDKIVNEILSNPEIDKALDNIEETRKEIEIAKNDDGYKNFTSIAPQRFVSELHTASFESSYNDKYDFESAFEKTESKFENDYKQKSSSESDYYKSKQEKDYSEFKENSKQWFDEKNFSESSSKQAEKTFATAKEAANTKYAKYYSQYKEPIEKLIKKCYSNSGGKWIKSFFEAIGIDFPFLDEFIDPIINEPIEDFITKKVEAIFRGCNENKKEVVEAVLKSCSSDFKVTFDAKVSSSSKFTKLESGLDVELASSKQISMLTKGQIASQLTSAETHLNEICAESRWETIRQSFLERTGDVYDLEEFTNEQRKKFRNALTDWNYYKEKEKLNWYFNLTNDIEEQFFNYSKDNGDLKAIWGFIIQQQDWDGAVNYYTNIHPDAAAKGKPYFMLKYYYNSIGKGNEFENLYDTETDNGVVIMCPH
jgi:hypothetical protein